MAHCARHPLSGLRRTSPFAGGRIKHREASLRKRLYNKHGLLCHRTVGRRWWRQPPKGESPSPAGRLYGFSRQRRHKKWRPKGRHTSSAGTVSQPIGKPFNGQAKGLLWLTWRSYAGPPQYFIPPEGGALNPPVRRSRSQAEPLAPRAVRPGGAINPRGKAASTFGNTASRRFLTKAHDLK